MDFFVTFLSFHSSLSSSFSFSSLKKVSSQKISFSFIHCTNRTRQVSSSLPSLLEQKVLPFSFKQFEKKITSPRLHLSSPRLSQHLHLLPSSSSFYFSSSSLSSPSVSSSPSSASPPRVILPAHVLFPRERSRRTFHLNENLNTPGSCTYTPCTPSEGDQIKDSEEEEEQGDKMQRKKNKREDEEKEENVSPLLVDRFGRKQTYLRISLTEDCNFKCRYCMPSPHIPSSPPSPRVENRNDSYSTQSSRCLTHDTPPPSSSSSSSCESHCGSFGSREKGPLFLHEKERRQNKEEEDVENIKEREKSRTEIDLKSKGEELSLSLFSSSPCSSSTPRQLTVDE
ncbi:cofactor of nitrate reductase and xanthine dehydrogenase 2 isoform 2, partial [Cystoisospora suis]